MLRSNKTNSHHVPHTVATAATAATAVTAAAAVAAAAAQTDGNRFARHSKQPDDRGSLNVTAVTAGVDERGSKTRFAQTCTAVWYEGLRILQRSPELVAKSRDTFKNLEILPGTLILIQKNNTSSIQLRKRNYLVV